jgi:hypothetical protein
LGTSNLRQYEPSQPSELQISRNINLHSLQNFKSPAVQTFTALGTSNLRQYEPSQPSELQISRNMNLHSLGNFKSPAI